MISIHDKYKINKHIYISLLNDNIYQIGGTKDKDKIKINTAIPQTITEKDLSKYVESNTKPAYQAYREDDNTLINNIANNGLQIGEIAVRHGGEYNGFAIRALEEIKPILTDDRVVRGIRHMAGGDIQKAIGVLQLKDEVYEYGLGIIYGVLKMWLENNEIPIPNEYNEKAIDIKSKRLIRWIEAYNWGSIEGRFEIADIGSGKGYSVVPETWLGREFKNAEELHKEMDKLDWRQGKSPVNFCCIYIMEIQPVKTWETYENILDLNIRIGIQIDINNKNNNKMISKINIFNTKKEYQKWYEDVPKQYNFLQLDLNTDDQTEKLILACNHDQIIESSPKYIKKRNVGLLVSTMQKLIRRGPTTSEALYDVLYELWRSPNYNLPEQQFLRVSACRQLAWRLFIMSIEDVQAFAVDSNRSDILSMPDLAVLAIMSNAYPDLQFKEHIFNKLLMTALYIQRIDTKWHMLREAENLQDDIPLKETNDQLLNSFVALSFYIPTRKWDDTLLKFSYNYISKKLFTPSKLGQYDLKTMLKTSIKKECDDALLAGMDMHSYPNLLILFQGSLSFLPYNPEYHTTRTLWNFIWDYSSRINFRYKEEKLSDENQKLLKILKNIQFSLLYPDKAEKNMMNFVNKNKNLYEIDIKNKYIKGDSYIDPLVKRTAFILLFGEKRTHTYKKKRYDMIISGCEPKDNEYCKVKIIFKDQSKYLDMEIIKK